MDAETPAAQPARRGAPASTAEKVESVDAVGVYGNVYEMQTNTDPDYSPEPAGELNTTDSEFPHMHDGQTCEVCEDPTQTHDQDGMPVQLDQDGNAPA